MSEKIRFLKFYRIKTRLKATPTQPSLITRQFSTFKSHLTHVS